MKSGIQKKKTKAKIKSSTPSLLPVNPCVCLMCVYIMLCYAIKIAVSDNKHIIIDALAILNRGFGSIQFSEKQNRIVDIEFGLH